MLPNFYLLHGLLFHNSSSRWNHIVALPGIVVFLGSSFLLMLFPPPGMPPQILHILMPNQNPFGHHSLPTHLWSIPFPCWCRLNDICWCYHVHLHRCFLTQCHLAERTDSRILAQDVLPVCTLELRLISWKVDYFCLLATIPQHAWWVKTPVSSFFCVSLPPGEKILNQNNFYLEHP